LILTYNLGLTTKALRHEDTKEKRDKGRREEGGGEKSPFLSLPSFLLLVP
jgi:hypothetical protein